MGERIDVMVSSTFKDFEKHRSGIQDAILRMGMHPLMMDHLPAADRDAIDESLRLVDAAEIYLGIFGFRYGYIPVDMTRNPKHLSITELEYRHAVERDIPRLCFFMAEQHPITMVDTKEDTTDSQEIDRRKKLLQALKDEIGVSRVVNFFKSPEELRALILGALAPYRHSDPAGSLHYISDIPAPPDEYVAHPYTLLAAADLAGRQRELGQLTDWIAEPSSRFYGARILSVVAIGGMGKSALTWKWFSQIASQEMKPLAGRMWWSFYESDASFGSFVIRALAYVSRTPREEVEKLPPPEREGRLLRILDAEPFLMVLDGLERILIAYARIDAAHLLDDDFDEQTANYVAELSGLPAHAGQSFVGQHRLRKTADVRAGQFLRRLAQVKASRILVSTRLYPADLQTVTGNPMLGCSAIFLPGLSNDDAVDLWRRMGMNGSREKLLSLFNRFENYPLLIRALAGEVANYKRAPGNFDQWIAKQVDFTLTLDRLTPEHRKAHVLQQATQDLSETEKQVLNVVAAFRMPASYDTLASLLIGESKLFAAEPTLDTVLQDLEDRGLIGWDRRANRYDLHPIVRSVTWSNLTQSVRQDIYALLSRHFGFMANVLEDRVESFDDLTPAIELYQALVGLEKYEDAFRVFHDLLDRHTLYDLSSSRQRAELLELLFTDDIAQTPRLRRNDMQASALNALAQGYLFSGQPGRAVPLYWQAIRIREREYDFRDLGIGLANLADALRQSGQLRESETRAKSAYMLFREQRYRFGEAVSLYYFGLVLSVRGAKDLAWKVLQSSFELIKRDRNKQVLGYVQVFISWWALWFNEFAIAKDYADAAWNETYPMLSERDFVRAARAQGQAELALGDLDTADERLHHALARARAINLVEEELPALIALAELARQRIDPALARELLDDVWESAERGPYPLFHVDALNLLAQIERDADNTQTAIDVAQQAYQLAWCDGISADGTEYWAYHRGLDAAKVHLDALGAAYPIMPPFDPADHEPLPEVKINLTDEDY